MTQLRIFIQDLTRGWVPTPLSASVKNARCTETVSALFTADRAASFNLGAPVHPPGSLCRLDHLLVKIGDPVAFPPPSRAIRLRSPV